VPALPRLRARARSLGQAPPDDIAFRRVPVWFREEPFTAQQRLFYALDSLGLLPTLHRRVYHAIHAERTRLRSPDDMLAFVTRNGVDAHKFMAAFNSFAVQSKGTAGAADGRRRTRSTRSRRWASTAASIPTAPWPTPVAAPTWLERPHACRRRRLIARVRKDAKN
jgi:hypothetical protein